MTTITSPVELPPGLMRWVQVKDEAEALKIADGKTAYFFRSRAVKACYVYIPVGEE